MSFQIAQRYGLSKSFFSRVKSSFDNAIDNPIFNLTTQYRMHPEICSFPNEYFYNGTLLADKSTIDNEFPLKPYSVLCLTYQQSSGINNNQFRNSDEADFIVKLLKCMGKYIDITKYSVGIVTPYTYQKIELNEKFQK